MESFAYAVSHDLRAPLRAMSGFSQALLEDYGELLKGDARVYLDQIMLASRRMGELIDGILQLSRITRGELQRDPVDISALAEGILAEFARLEPTRQMNWHVEQGLAAHGDPRMIEVVLRNLIERWKYTRTPTHRRSGICRPGIGKRLSAFSCDGQWRRFRYDPLRQAVSAFSAAAPSGGISGTRHRLATVQRIIHRHGGRIGAVATPGQGATFSFSLPAAYGNEETR